MLKSISVFFSSSWEHNQLSPYVFCTSLLFLDNPYYSNINPILTLSLKIFTISKFLRVLPYSSLFYSLSSLKAKFVALPWNHIQNHIQPLFTAWNIATTFWATYICVWNIKYKANAFETARRPYFLSPSASSK